MDDEPVKVRKAHEVGMVLDEMSVEELNSRIEILKGEITRLEEAIVARRASRSTADALFKF